MKKTIILCLTLSLLVFTYQSAFAQKSPKNVIFMIGDGMGLAQIYAGMVAQVFHDTPFQTVLNT